VISPFVDWLISLIAESRCVLGEEEFVELAVREAVSNAMTVAIARMLASWLMSVAAAKVLRECFIVVRDQGNGFDPSKVPDPLAVEDLGAEPRDAAST